MIGQVPTTSLAYNIAAANQLAARRYLHSPQSLR